MMIILPTKELVSQVTRITSTFAKPCHITSKSVITSQLKSIETNRHEIMNANQVMIGVPESMAYFLRQRWGNHVKNQNILDFLILDEADVLLRIGSGNESFTKSLVESCPVHTQIIFVGATARPTFSYLKSIRKDAVMIETDRMGHFPSNLRLYMEHVLDYEGYNKQPALERALKRSLAVGKHILIFCRDTKSVESTSKFIKECLSWDLTIPVISLHGEIHASKRTELYKLINNEQHNNSSGTIIVATDLASRGLDITNLNEVIIFDCDDMHIYDLIHRVGRTARGGKSGNATLIIGRGEAQFGKSLTRAIAESQRTKISLEECFRKIFNHAS
jgi:superfamily II DNA/RNA helicase